MISSNLHEILGLTDRIMVLQEGSLATKLTTAEMTLDDVLNYAVGLATAIQGGARMPDKEPTQAGERP
jgi:ABC-type dipeptide/oligopeptide/nickel transport system ATPase component